MDTEKYKTFLEYYRKYPYELFSLTEKNYGIKLHWYQKLYLKYLWRNK